MSQNGMYGLGEGNFLMIDDIPISTIYLPGDDFKRFLTFPCQRSLHESPRCSQNKTIIKGANPGISYQLWDKKRLAKMEYCLSRTKVCGMEYEIVMFVETGSAEIEFSDSLNDLPEMRIWSIVLIQSNLKWCIDLRRSFFLYFNDSVSVTAFGTVSHPGHM